MNSPVSHAIILLAGTGSRLKPLTDATHKSLLKVGHQTFLERLLRQLSQNGIQHFHLALGYRSDEVQDYVTKKLVRAYGHTPLPSVSFYENPQFATTNNAYSLQLVLNQLADERANTQIRPYKIESFILLDGDVMMSDELVTHFMNQREKSFIVCDTRKDRLNEEAMKCIVDDKNRVVLLNKKISVVQAFGESVGVACLQNDWCAAIKLSLAKNLKDPTKKKSWYYEDIFVDVLTTNKTLSALQALSTKDLPWIEVDDVKDFEEAKRLFGI